MALFSFCAKTADGMDRNGAIEATDEKEAVKKLQQEGLVVVTLEAKRNPNGISQLRDYLAFRKMITPVIIWIVFWLGTAICIIGGLIGIFSGAVVFLLGGFLLLTIGTLTVRLWCELLILFFRINETLTEIKNNVERKT